MSMIYLAARVTNPLTGEIVYASIGSETLAGFVVKGGFKIEQVEQVEPYPWSIPFCGDRPIDGREGAWKRQGDQWEFVKLP